MKVAWKRIARVWATLGASAGMVFVGWCLIAYRASTEARQAAVTDAKGW